MTGQYVFSTLHPQIDSSGSWWAINPATGQLARLIRGIHGTSTYGSEWGGTDPYEGSHYFFEADPQASLDAQLRGTQLSMSAADKEHFSVGKGIVQAGLAAIATAGAASISGIAGKLIPTTLKAAFASANKPPPPPRSETMFEDTGSTSWGDVFAQGLGMAQQLLMIKANAAASVQPAAMAFPALPAIGGVLSRLGLGAMPAVIGGAVRAGSRLIQTAIGAISKKRVVAIAKQLGIQGAATALGIGAVEIAQMVIDDGGKGRRRSGITSAQMRTTRRTIGKIENAHRQIVAACSSARVPTRRSSRSCPPPKIIVTKR